MQNVTLFYRNHSADYGNAPPAFTALSMIDDGTHNDGAANDGLYAATLTPQANRTVIEFYVQAIRCRGPDPHLAGADLGDEQHLRASSPTPFTRWMTNPRLPTCPSCA